MLGHVSMADLVERDRDVALFVFLITKFREFAS